MQRTDWTLVLLLWAAGLLAAMQFAKVSLTLPALAEAYPGWAAAVPFAVSAVSLCGLILGAAAGVILARVGLARAVMAALLAGAALSAVQAAMPPFPALLLLRAVEGAAHLALVVALPVLIAGVAAAKDQPIAMGLWGAFFGVGFALAAPAVAALLDLGGVPAVFLAHGAAMAGLALALRGRMPAPQVKAAPPREGWIAAHLRLYTTLRTAAPAAVFLWHTLMFVALLTYLPGALGAGPLLAAALPLAGIAGSLSVGGLARRIAPLPLAGLSFVVTAVLCAALVAVPEAARPALSLAAFFAMGIAPGAAFAAIPALNATEADRAAASGAVAQLGNLGTGAGTPLFALALAAGVAGLSAAALLCALAGAGTAALLVLKLRSAAPASATSGHGAG